MSEPEVGTPMEQGSGVENPEMVEPEVYNCTEPGCDKSFSSLAALRGHSRIHVKRESTITPTTSPDSERDFWKSEAGRLKDEVAARRLEKERQKYVPAEKDGDVSDLMKGRLYEEMSEYYAAKKEALQSNGGDRTPAIIEPDPRIAELNKKVEELSEALKKKELDELKGQIAQLREDINRRPQATDNIQVALLNTLNSRLDGLQKTISPITTAISAYLMPSGTVNLPAPAAGPNEIPPSAMAQELAKRGLIQ